MLFTLGAASQSFASCRVVWVHYIQGHSSMSRTVSLPVAVAVRAVLDGRLKLTGLVRPVIPEVYNLILKEMAGLSSPVKFVETVGV